MTKHLNYSIRMHMSSFEYVGDLYPFLSLSKKLYDTENETSSHYFTECFLTIQNKIDRAFIMKSSKNNRLPKVTFRKFAYPSVRFDPFLEALGIHMVPVFVVIAFIYSTKTIIRVSFMFANFMHFSLIFLFFRTLPLNVKVK